MTKKLNIIPTPVLGGGYSTDMQMATLEPCVNTSNVIYASGDKSTINMGNSQTFLQIQGLLGTYTGMSVFSDDPSSIFAGQIQDNLYSQTFHFYEQIVFPTQSLIPTGYGINALNGLGQGNYNISIEQFRAVCGDQFIGQIHYGANLFVAFQIIFDSLYYKQVFGREVDVSGFAGLFDTSTTTQTIITEYNLEGTVNLLAYQSGGNPSDLAQIFAKNTNGYYITSCALSNLKICQQAINGVLNYAVNAFPNQVNMTNGEIIGNAAPIGYTYFPYTALGLNASTTVITTQITQARENLANLYNELLEQGTFVSHILGSWIVPHMSSSVLSRMQSILGNITTNINLLEDSNNGAIVCYTLPENCLSTEQAIMNAQTYVNTTLIDSFSKEYQIQCQLSYSCGFNLGNDKLTPLGDGNFTSQLTGDNYFVYTNRDFPGMLIECKEGIGFYEINFAPPFLQPQTLCPLAANPFEIFEGLYSSIIGGEQCYMYSADNSI